jgi:hypothetical protein
MEQAHSVIYLSLSIKGIFTKSNRKNITLSQYCQNNTMKQLKNIQNIDLKIWTKITTENLSYNRNTILKISKCNKVKNNKLIHKERNIISEIQLLQ